MAALTFESQMQLGVALHEQGKLEEAAEAFWRAIDFNQDRSDALQCLAATLHDLGQFEAALDHIRRALALAETDDREAGYLVNAGFILTHLQRPHEAIAYLQRALLCNPDRADARIHLAAAQLADGDYAAAWETLPATQRQGHRVPPRWHGEPAAGKRLLVIAEQGYGDILQFSRYLPMLRARGMAVTVYTQPPLVRLLQQSFPAVQVRTFGRPIGDMSIPVMALPMAFRTTLETVPAEVPYLLADPAQVEAWRQRLAAFEGLKVGLCWAGNPRPHIAECNAMDRRRSMSPERLGGLVAQSGCHFFSLQKTPPFAPASFGLIDYMTEMNDFADTAALVANLDLVISVDSAVAHLAGGLGRPVWLLDRFDTSWRWLLGRTDSPWYPTLRIVRQPKPGDWDSVLADVQRDLAALADAAENGARSVVTKSVAYPPKSPTGHPARR